MIDLDEIRQHHIRQPDEAGDYCPRCGDMWPCDAVTLADELEALRARPATCSDARHVGLVCVLTTGHGGYHTSSDGTAWGTVPRGARHTPAEAAPTEDAAT